LSGDLIDPFAYVISANIRRRHLTADQKRDVIEKLLKATPEKSNRRIAETVKASHNTVQAVRSEMEGRGQIDHVSTRADTKGRKQPASKSKPPKPAEPCKTPALMKGQEDRVIDEQFPETRRAIERLVQYAASCNRAAGRSGRRT